MNCWIKFIIVRRFKISIGVNKYQRGNIGEINYNKEGCKIEVIDGGTKYSHCIVRIFGGYKIYEKEVYYKDFKNGQIKNLYYPSVYKIGYLGVGKHKPSIKGNRTKKYSVWVNMFKRCYNPYRINKNLCYENVFVCKEWHNFQNFGDWFDENYREFKNTKSHLDKDLLSYKYKIYSPETCIFIPVELNNFMTNNKSDNTSGYTGVCKMKHFDKYEVDIADFTNELKQTRIGLFHNINEAIDAYNKRREELGDLMRLKCINEWGITNERLLKNIK